MNRTVQVALLVLAIGVSAMFLLYFGVRSANDGGEGTWTSKERQLAQALEKAGGDPNKLDPATQKELQQTLAQNPMSTVNHYSAKPGSGRAQTMPSGTDAQFRPPTR
jgi:hypothetical protein